MFKRINNSPFYAIILFDEPRHLIKRGTLSDIPLLRFLDNMAPVTPRRIFNMMDGDEQYLGLPTTLDPKRAKLTRLPLKTMRRLREGAQMDGDFMKRNGYYYPHDMRLHVSPIYRTGFLTPYYQFWARLTVAGRADMECMILSAPLSDICKAHHYNAEEEQ